MNAFSHAKGIEGISIWLLVCLLVLATHQPVSAQHLRDDDAAQKTKPGTLTKIKVAGGIIPNLFDTGGDGPYNKIYDWLITNQTNTAQLIMLPSRRAQRAFNTKITECLFISTSITNIHQNNGLSIDDLIFSKPVHLHTLHVYSRPGVPVAHGIDDLAGKNVAIDAAAASPEGARRLFGLNEANLIPSSTTVQAFTLLASERVDYVVAFKYDVKALGVRLPSVLKNQHDPKFILFENPEVFVCHKSPETKTLVREIDQTIDLLNSTGKLAQLFQISSE